MNGRLGKMSVFAIAGNMNGKPPVGTEFVLAVVNRKKEIGQQPTIKEQMLVMLKFPLPKGKEFENKRPSKESLGTFFKFLEPVKLTIHDIDDGK